MVLRLLILASTSRYRRALLERLGVPFRCEAPRVDEDAFKSRGLAPRDLAEMLAAEKATSLSRDFPQATIIGSDQVAACDGRILGKPGTTAQAVAQLEHLSGRSHELITAVAVWHAGRLLRHTDVTTLHMRRLGRDAIARYVAADQPLDCAGAYKLEQRGIALFTSIASADQTAIVGLPLIALASLLNDCGYAIP